MPIIRTLSDSPPRRAPWLGALLLCGGMATAAEPGIAPLQTSARFTTFENDNLVHTDHDYTNGLQFSHKHSDDTRAAWLRRSMRQWCDWLGCADARLISTQSNLGQLIYTPSDITLSAPQPLDRPWAGLLYVEQVYALLSADQRTLTTLSVEAGVTGPASLSEQTQRLVHRVTSSRPPQGWDNQIGGSLALMASVEQRNAFAPLSAELGGNVQLRAASYWRLAAGNLMTYAGAGAALTLGKNLPLVAPAPAGISTKMVDPPAPDTACLWSWLQCTAFTVVEARAMGYNLFLDGRLGRSDPHVTRRTLVLDLMFGLRLDFPHSRGAQHGPWFAQLKVTRRSPEFRAPVLAPYHTVGALTVGTEF
jgi:lipid A 3-O-deacylase